MDRSVPTDVVKKATTKLNTQVQLRPNLRAMYAKSTAASYERRQLELEKQDWARLQGRGHGPARASG